MSGRLADVSICCSDGRGGGCRLMAYSLAGHDPDRLDQAVQPRLRRCTHGCLKAPLQQVGSGTVQASGRDGEHRLTSMMRDSQPASIRGIGLRPRHIIERTTGTGPWSSATGDPSRTAAAMNGKEKAGFMLKTKWGRRWASRKSNGSMVVSGSNRWLDLTVRRSRWMRRRSLDVSLSCYYDTSS